MEPSTSPGPRLPSSEAFLERTSAVVIGARIAIAGARAPDRDALEQALLALAVHPDGAGAHRARWFAHDANGAALVERRSATTSADRAGLIESIDRAFRERTGVLDHGARLALDDLGGALEFAWARGIPAVGPAADAALPWSPSGPIGAVAIRFARGPAGLLVLEWSEDAAAAMLDEGLRISAACMETLVVAFEGRADLEWKTRRAVALAEFTRALASPSNLAELLHRLARIAADVTGASGSAVWTRDARGAARLSVTYGASAERERFGRALLPLATQTLRTGRSWVAEHAAPDLPIPPEVTAELGALRMAPIAAYGRTLGVLAVYERIEADSRADADFDAPFLEALADLAAVAMDHAARFDELQVAERRSRDAAQHLARVERLAAVGEIARSRAHEARNPLASIRAFTRRLHEQLPPEDGRREYVEIVGREAERLERLLESPLDATAQEPPTLRLEGMNDAVQEALAAAGETLVRRRIRLLKKLAPEIPALLLDPDRMRLVLGNVLHGALEAVAVGGRIRVETRRVGTHVVTEIAHDGPCAPGDALDRLFVPFASSKSGSPAIGLAVAHRIVREHGGEIRVRSEGEWSTVIALTIPVPDNQDRRRTRMERRRGADRRRTASASA